MDKIQNSEIKEETNNYSKYVIKIIDLKRISANSDECEYNNSRNYKNDRLILKIKSKDNLVGNYIIVDGNYERGEVARNYKGFNYRTYIKSNNWEGICKCKKNVNLNIKKSKKISTIYNIKIYLKDTILKKNIKNVSGFIIALILGDKSFFDNESIELFRKAGLSHILAVSGMHVSYVLLIISFICKKFKKYFKIIVSIISLIVFSELSGNSISIIRADVMIILAFIASVLHRRSESINNLFFIMLVMMIYNPYVIFNMSFLLSFAGTFGIIVFAPKLLHLINFDLMESKIKKRAIFKISKYIIMSIIISISANLVLFPIIVYFYNEFSISFIFSSFIVSSMLTIIMPIALLAMVMYFINNQYLIACINLLLNFIVKLFINIVSFFSNLKILNLKICGFSLYHIVLYYILLLGIFCILNNKVNEYRKVFIRKIIKVTIILCLIICIIFKVINILDNKITIYCIDVGQGDSILISTKLNNILIDGGGQESYKDEGNDYIGENVLKPYLYNRSIKKIDYVVVSHLDTDHVGGILSVLNEFKVRNIIVSKQFKITNNYKNLMNIAKDKRINIIEVQAGDEIIIEKDIYMQVLWPNSQNYIQDNIINNNSLVFKLVYKNFSMLFTGDIEKKAEQELLNSNEDILNALVLKVPHHGSKTSTSKEFLEKIKPKYACIEVGKDNKFGHPSKEIITRLQENGCEIFRTDINGEIIIETDGTTVKFKKRYDE